LEHNGTEVDKPKEREPLRKVTEAPTCSSPRGCEQIQR